MGQQLEGVEIQIERYRKAGIRDISRFLFRWAARNAERHKPRGSPDQPAWMDLRSTGATRAERDSDRAGSYLDGD